MKEQITFVWENHFLHDTLLTALGFEFESNEIYICFEMYDDEAEEEVPFKMIFGGVYKFTSEFPENEDFKPNECTSWRWEETEAGRFEAVFTFLNADNLIGWCVTIGFTSLRTEGGLSEEARAARAAYFEAETGEID